MFLLRPNALVQLQAHYHHAAKPHPKSACQLQRSLAGSRADVSEGSTGSLDLFALASRVYEAVPRSSESDRSPASGRLGASVHAPG